MTSSKGLVKPAPIIPILTLNIKVAGEPKMIPGLCMASEHTPQCSLKSSFGSLTVKSTTRREGAGIPQPWWKEQPCPEPYRPTCPPRSDNPGLQKNKNAGWGTLQKHILPRRFQKLLSDGIEHPVYGPVHAHDNRCASSPMIMAHSFR